MAQMISTTRSRVKSYARINAIDLNWDHAPFAVKGVPAGSITVKGRPGQLLHYGQTVWPTRSIGPRIRALVAEGWNAVGPVAPDTVFARAASGAFDVVIAMYHDQGHIPAKLIGFHDTLNVTLGLPIVRVSVDHGTAYDIAWQGKADAGNMGVAVREALRMVGYGPRSAV